MSVRLIHAFDAAWTASGGAAASVLSAGPHEDAPAANILVFPGGAPGAEAAFAPAAPLDLGPETELRLWLRIPRTASPGFALRFGFDDAADAPGAGPRWRLPVARPGWWEQLRVGIDRETRSAVQRFVFAPDGEAGVEVEAAELLAVRPEMTTDLETAIAARVARTVSLPELAAIPVTAPAAVGDGALTVEDRPGLAAGMDVEIADGLGATQRATAAAVASAAGEATLTLAAGETLDFALAPGAATARVLVRLETEPRPEAGPLPPAVRLWLLDAREDRRRTAYVALRDSFGAADGMAAERPHPRGWLVDYQLSAEAPLRAQRLRLLDGLAAAFNVDRPLRVGGVLTPCEAYLRPDLPRRRQEFVPETLHLRVSAQQEAGSRRYARLAEIVDLAAAPEGAPAEPVRITG